MGVSNVSCRWCSTIRRAENKEDRQQKITVIMPGMRSQQTGRFPNELINDDEEVATYKITGSDFVFANLKLDCSGVNECNIDKIIPLSWPSMMPNEIALSARSPQLYVSASESSSSVLCMDCLQENAAARFISKFRVNKLKVVRIVYMIYGALLNTQHLKCTDYCPGLTILEEMDNSKQLVQIFRSEEHLPLSRIRHHVIQCNALSHK